MGSKINLIDPEGIPRTFDSDDPSARDAIAAGWTLEAPEAAAARTIKSRVAKDYDTPVDHALGAGAAGLRGITAGLSDVGIRALGGDDAAYELARQRESIGDWATPLEIAGAVVPGLLTGGAGELGAIARATPAGLISRGGAAIARLGEGGSALAKLGATAAAGAFEGGAQEVGSGLSDLALSNDPLTLERIAGALPSRFIYGGSAGGIAGAALGGLDVGLHAAGRRLSKAREAFSAADAITDDLAALDRKGLREAHDAELARIEAERVPERVQVVDELSAYRAAAKESTPWAAVATGNKTTREVATANATKAARRAAKAEAAAAQAERAAAIAESFGSTETREAASQQAKQLRAAAEEAASVAANAADDAAAAGVKSPRWMRESEKLYIESDKTIDRLLRNRKALVERPAAIRTALQAQEQVLDDIMSKSDELKVLHATDRTGRRAAALAELPSWLERNRALQDRVAALTAAPASSRLSAIGDAIDALGTAKSKTLGEKMASGAAYGLAHDIVGSIPFVGRFAAPFAGAAAADAVGGKLGPALLAATKTAAERAQRAVDAVMSINAGAKRVAPKIAGILASKVLAGTRFAPDDRPPGERTPARSIEEAFDQRADEVARSVAPGPNGAPKVRPHVRQQIAERLAPLAQVAPIAADRIQTHAVKRLELVARKMPRSEQIGLSVLRPSDMEMRGWARTIAAVDDPDGILERVAHGTVTLEDAEVMQELYPERLAAFTAQVIAQLPALRARLPYHRRMALSMLTGVPVDAAMDPAILRQLQAQYLAEPGTEGGTRAPRPQPAFGSVRKSLPEPTAAQRRAG